LNIIAAVPVVSPPVLTPPVVKHPETSKEDDSRKFVVGEKATWKDHSKK